MQTNNIPINFGQCSQCGLIHPPIRPGEKCPLTQPQPQQTQNVTSFSTKPNIQQQNITTPQTVNITDINKFLVDLRNIILSQISIKKIKNPQKLFNNIVIEVTKTMENFKE